MFVAVARAAADQPHVVQHGMPVDDEVIVDAVLALADFAFDQRLLCERRKPRLYELAAPA